MNSPKFFDEVRTSLFGGKLTEEQVTGINAIFAAWGLWGTGDRRHLAYIFATAYHETGRRMVPVREGQGRRKLWSDQQARRAVTVLFEKGRISRDYGKPNAKGLSFYGRGMVQITHEENYARMGKIIGMDLAANPDKALDLDVSARILVEGCLDAVSVKGDFTAYSLEDFIHDDKCDYRSARKVINGMDKADAIAGYAQKFEAALEAAGSTHDVFRAGAKVEGPRSIVPVDGTYSKALQDIQTKLKALGYADVGKTDGKWGSKTRGAVLAFRADNAMELLPIIDEAFLAAVNMATPRAVSEERATAKPAEVKKEVPAVAQVSLFQKIAAFLGLTSLASGTLSIDELTGLKEKLTALKGLFDVLPSSPTLLMFGGVGLAGYVGFKMIGHKLIKAYREGQIG